jgi:hypothetical protein
MNEEQKLVLCFLLTTVLYLGDAGNSPTAPNEPRNISRKSKTCNSITISWKKPMGMEADSEIHYEIFSGGVDNGILLGNVTGVRRAHLSSLQPDTLYMLRVRARNTFGPGPPSLPENITTKSIKCLDVSILSNEISGRTATVTVKIQDSNSFLCNITKQSDSDSTASIMEIEGNITNTINNLNPNTTYNVDCSIEGNMCTKAKGTFTTNATVPGNVTSVLENVSCNSIMISWHPPKEDGGSTILDYNVSIFRLNENRNNRLVLRTTVLTGGNTTVSYFGLKPRTQYSVHISAKNSVGLGLPLVHPVTTDKRMRMTINVTRISRNSAMLSTNSRDLLLCWIESTTGQVNFSVTVEKMPTLMNLTSNTKYTFDCIGKDNQCAFSKGNFETLALTVPRHPTSVTDDMKTCTSTHISWMKPDDDGGSAVLGYNVTIFNGSEHRYVSYNGVNSLRVTLMSLKPKTSYNLYIRARNSVGLGPPAVFNFTTEDTRNISTMAAVTTSNSINFTLNDTSQEYVCIIVPQDAIAMQPSVLIRGTGVFTGLKPNTNYYLNCVGINDNCSVSSTSFQTRVGAPNPPAINAMTENCTTITLSLTPPNITGGQKIQEYNIIWYTRSEEQPETRIVPGNSTSVTLTGLSPRTSYTINVSSNNSEVTGHATSIVHATAKRSNINTTVVITSNSINFTLNDTNQRYTCTITPQDAIEEQDLVTISKHGTGVFRGLQPNTNYSLNCGGIMDNCSVSSTNFRTRVGAPDPPVVKVLKEDCTSISLSLTPPNITGGEMIQKYNIWYTSSGVQPKTRMVSGESFSVTLTGLSPNTEYSVNVSSNNSEVTGHATSIVHATAKRSNINTTVVITSNSINFTLNDTNQRYTCTITPQDAIEEQDLVTISKHGTGVFRGLQPNTNYSLNCGGIMDNCSVSSTNFRTRVGGMTQDIVS